MNGWPALDRFLQTDPRDVGCAEAMDMLHIYAELIAASGPAEQQYPGIAAHLRGPRPGNHSARRMGAQIILIGAPEPMSIEAVLAAPNGGSGAGSDVGSSHGV